MFKTSILYFLFIFIILISLMINYDGVLKIMHPVYGGSFQTVMQITDNGEFRKFNVKAYAESGKLIFDRTGYFIREAYDLERPASAIEISDASGADVLKRLSLGNQITDRIIIQTDLNSDFDITRITPIILLKSSWSVLNFTQKLFIIFITMVLFFILVIIPLSFISMVFSLIMDLRHGIYRPFTGLWINLIIGFAWLYLGYHFGVIDTMLKYPSPYARVLFLLFCSGYVLYFFADRRFEKRNGPVPRNSSGLIDVNTPGSSRSDHQDMSCAKQPVKTRRSIIAVIAELLIIPALLPLATFWFMYRYWLLPVLRHNYSWKTAGGNSSGTANPA